MGSKEAEVIARVAFTILGVGFFIGITLTIQYLISHFSGSSHH
ncbi:MAG: hypothetical protein QMD53_00070 [Actinomycetota bacterium]|nr:hypothetical protein [Actinomycetota bacterium]